MTNMVFSMKINGRTMGEEFIYQKYKRDDGDGRDGDSRGVSNTVTIVTTVTERNEADEKCANPL